MTLPAHRFRDELSFEGHAPEGSTFAGWHQKLPAHRFEERKKNDDDAPKTWVYDFDETITIAPKQLARMATALRAMGDRIVVLTGNQSPRADLMKRLTDDYNFPFDDLIQYHDLGSDGIARSKYLKQLDAYCGIDDRAARAATYADVCPHLFLIAQPTNENEDDAKGAKKDAKKAVKKLKRSEERSTAPSPPNYRPSDTPGEACGTCEMDDNGVCWGYGNTPVDADHVCDSWSPETG